MSRPVPLESRAENPERAIAIHRALFDANAR
jgi:hypothetical protein